MKNQELTPENLSRLISAAGRGQITLRVIHSEEEEREALAEGWTVDYEALPAPKPAQNKQEELKQFHRELEELVRLQKEGAFGKPLDLGNYSWPCMTMWLDALVQTQDSPWGPI